MICPAAEAVAHFLKKTASRSGSGPAALGIARKSPRPVTTPCSPFEKPVSITVNSDARRGSGNGFHQVGTSHSLNFDHLFRPETFLTAIATAFFCPTSTTSRFPRVRPV